MGKVKQHIFAYEVFMLLLAVISIFLIIEEHKHSNTIHWAIWGIFLLDYIVRLFNSRKKAEFVKENILDLVVLIPLEGIFQAARFAHIFRIIRLFVVAKRFAIPAYQIMKKNYLDKAFVFTTALIFLAAIPVKLVEPKIETYTDALWWALVTATTVGYGDISPETLVGRFIAIMVMIFGIGLTALFTGAIASYFINQDREEHPVAKYIKSELKRMNELTEEDIERMKIMLDTLKPTYDQQRKEDD